MAQTNPDRKAAADAADRPLDGGPPDADLVSLAQTGDPAAYETLIRRYHTRVYGMVYNMTSHAQDAEDIVQTIFVKAYRALGSFRGRSSFSTWLYRIAMNTTFNHLERRNRTRGEMSLNDFDQGVERDPVLVELQARESPVRDISLVELQERLNAALQTLSEEHRSVVVLHDIEGLPHEEIAELMGLKVGTVRSRLFYARQLLQAELAEFAP